MQPFLHRLVRYTDSEEGLLVAQETDFCDKKKYM